MSSPDLPFKMSTRRTHPPLMRGEYAEHIKHVGEITFAWTQMHAAFFSIFFALLEKDHRLAHGLWHCIMSDATQRAMLVATAQAKLQKKKHLLKQIIWVTDCARKLSPFRNDLAHTGVAIDFDEEAGQAYLIPDFMSGKSAAIDRLDQPAIHRAWHRAAGDMRALETYARSLALRLMGGDRKISGSWPRRPKLLSIAATGQAGRPKTPPLKPIAPPPRRPSWVRSGGGKKR